MEHQLTVEDYTQIHKELTQEDNGVWTALVEDNNSKNNSKNRFRRLKALNYFLFESLTDKPYELWFSDGIKHKKQNLDADDYKKCICGHQIWEYAVVESAQKDRAYIGMCCIQKFDKEWDKTVREVMKKCPCGKKKVMTKSHCKHCRNCIKCNIIKPMRRLYDEQCITCSEEAEKQQREKIRIDALAKEKASEELKIKKERERTEYITGKIEILKEASTYVKNDWEKTFISDLMKKFIEYKNPLILSDKQENCLNRIVNYGRYLNTIN